MVLAAALCFTGLSGPTPRIEPVHAVSSSDGRTPSYPPAMGGPDVAQPVMLTNSEVRKWIVESADLYSAVSKVTAQSPTIDKLVTSEILMACAYLRPQGKRAPVEQAAAQELVTRCAGIRQNFRRDGALDRAVELRVSAENDQSSLGRLLALSQRPEGRRTGWRAGDQTLVSDALRSGDSLLVREATRVLLAQLDDGSPDASLRIQAFAHAAELFALSDSGLRTNFHALVDCVSMGRCAADNGASKPERDMAHVGVREQSEINRLVQEYRLALLRRTTALELLSVR